LLDVTNDRYASEGEATLVGVFGKDGEFQIEVFIKPSTLEVAIRMVLRPRSTAGPGPAAYPRYYHV
jgi:hypothetical protein